MKRSNMLSSLDAAIGLTASAVASANAVVDWNEIALPIIAANRADLPSALDSALVHIAVHDAHRRSHSATSLTTPRSSLPRVRVAQPSPLPLARC
jgi:hypothetical protein